MRLTDNLFFYPEQGMLDCNTYVIRDGLTIIIDPGSPQFLPALIQGLHTDGIEPNQIDIITNTHLHVDHCWANEAFKGISAAKISIHPLHKKFYDSVVVGASQIFGFEGMEFKEDNYLDGSKLNTGKMEFEFIPSPGHSPDSICFY